MLGLAIASILVLSYVAVAPKRDLLWRLMFGAVVLALFGLVAVSKVQVTSDGFIVRNGLRLHHLEWSSMKGAGVGRVVGIALLGTIDLMDGRTIWTWGIQTGGWGGKDAIAIIHELDDLIQGHHVGGIL